MMYIYIYIIYIYIMSYYMYMYIYIYTYEYTYEYIYMIYIFFSDIVMASQNCSQFLGSYTNPCGKSHAGRLIWDCDTETLTTYFLRIDDNP
jgi:hypothetical protein